MSAPHPMSHSPCPSRSQSVTVYRPNMRHELGSFRVWGVMARNVWEARELIWQLFKRDFVAGYKKSFIGLAWVFIMPVVGIVSWVFLQKTGLLSPGDVGIPYPAYVLVGTSMWGLFMSLYNAAVGTLQAGGALVLQVNYPHEALLFKQMAQSLANFLIAFVLNIAVLIFFKVYPSWGILVFPLVALPLFFVATGIGLIVSMIAVVAMDLNNFIGIAMKFVMYAMPIVYADNVPSRFIQVLIKWNPMTYLVCSCRDIIIYGRLYNPPAYFLCAAGAFVLFMISWRLFYVSEHQLVERMI